MANNVRLTSPGEIDDNDKLFALLAYIIGILVPAFILLSDANKSRPFQRYHAVQSLALSVVVVGAWIVLSIGCAILGFIPIVNIIAAFAACLFLPLGLVVLGVFVWYAIMAYQGKYFDVPMLTDFVRQQGWL